MRLRNGYGVPRAFIGITNPSNRKHIMAKLSTSLCAVAVLTVSSASPQQILPPTTVDPNAPAGQIPGAPGTVPAANGLPAGAARLNDFQGDPIDLVLRTLARQAKMNIVVSDKVAQSAGTVNMRIEDKTPKEAIEIIVESKALVIDQGKGDVYYIKTAEAKAKEPTES